MAIAAQTPVVGDLLETNTHLVVECCRPGCPRRKRRLSAVEAVELFSADAPIEGLARRLRCSACGARGRDGFVTARPCTLDHAAWRLREQASAAAARGETLSWDLDEELATLRQLLAGGDLGGDGPVQGPPAPASKGL